MTTGPKIEFHVPTHTYLVEGRRVRSVTQILAAAGISDYSMVPRAVLETAQMRGTAVHRAVHFAMENDLDESTVDPVVRPYLDAHTKFMRESRFRPEYIEHVVYDENFDYVGTLDVRGFHPVAGKCVADWKSGEPSPAWGPQIAAYVYACVGKYRCYDYRRVVVQLRKTRDYKLHWFDNFEADFDIFTRALHATRQAA